MSSLSTNWNDVLPIITLSICVSFQCMTCPLFNELNDHKCIFIVSKSSVVISICRKIRLIRRGSAVEVGDSEVDAGRVDGGVDEVVRFERAYELAREPLGHVVALALHETETRQGHLDLNWATAVVKIQKRERSPFGVYAHRLEPHFKIVVLHDPAPLNPVKLLVDPDNSVVLQQPLGFRLHVAQVDRHKQGRR